MTIETKYNIGDKVWCNPFGAIQQAIIVSSTVYFDAFSELICYIVKIIDEEERYYRLSERKLFPTKEELLKSEKSTIL